MGACLSWDANYHPPPQRVNPWHQSDEPMGLLYRFAKLKNDGETLKTYVNVDRTEHINELYFRWQEWLTSVMTWLNGSNLITNDSGPWCIFNRSSKIGPVQSEPWCGMCYMPPHPFYIYQAILVPNPCAPTSLPSTEIILNSLGCV